mgnify:CR=1 FL=1
MMDCARFLVLSTWPWYFESSLPFSHPGFRCIVEVLRVVLVGCWEHLAGHLCGRGALC